MPTIIDYTLATILFATSLGIALRTLRIIDATLRQRQMIADAGYSCCSLGTIGCSILCSGIKEIDKITALLSTEHDRVEVIITLDTNLYAEDSEQIIRHFKLMRVNTPDHSELPHTHIRALYRSRQRCFRRLILLDQGYVSPHDDMNSASVVASYDYLIPLAAPYCLRPDALDNIFIALAKHTDLDIDILRSRVDGGAVIQRDIVMAMGGFSAGMRYNAARVKTLTVDFPLLTLPSTTPRPLFFILFSATIALLVYLLFGLKIALIALLTSAIIILSAHYAARRIYDDCSAWAILYHIIDIRSFFCRRKFLVS